MADDHHLPSLNSKEGVQPAEQQQKQQIILRTIASYLSLGDAESMASLSRPSPRYCYSAATPHHHSSSGIANNNGTPGLTGYHSLDYHFYHTIGTAATATGDSGMESSTNNNLRREGDDDGNVSLLGSNSSVGGAAAAGQRQYQHQVSPSSSNNNTNNNDDEEDWFVGGRGQTPGLVALSPLEEEFYGPDDGQQHLQQPINSTPAGQPTSESEGDEPSRMGNVTNIATPRNNSSSSRRKMADINNNYDDGENSNTCGVTEDDDDDDDDDDLSYYVRRENSLRRKSLQHKLAAAVFAHPYPLRQYCLDAYGTAMKLSMERQKQQEQMAALEENERYLEDPPETAREPVPTIVSPSTELHGPRDSSPELGEHQQQLRGTGHGGNQLQQLHRHRYHHHLQQEKRLRKQHQSRAKIIRVIISKLLSNAPLSILLDIAESVCDLSLETLFATGKIGLFTIDKCINILCNTVLNILDVLTSFNPFHVFEHVINLQRSAVGKTGDVVVSGIMSVATGVGSVSNAALNRLSRQGLALAGGVVIAGTGSRSGRSGSHDYARKDAGSGGNPLDSKLFRRLHKMDSVSTLLAYSERSGEDAFSKHSKKRAQRMMHYNVSFQPFTATIHPKSPAKSNRMRHNVSFELSSFRSTDVSERDDDASLSEESLNSSGSIFMRTPTSFPPTPTSRLYYFERGSRFTENVIFLARDQLRVERGLDNQNEQTRAMSSALREGSRLAVFDAADAGGGGIALSCGQHIATKVGNALYCSTRSMIPVMRNSYVYFEISVSPPPSMDASGNNVNTQVAVATLSIGLSTLEMPLNTLVGAWKGSVGLCSTGQILQAGQWLSSNSQEHSTYGCNSTVGCLVYIDDTSAFDTWEGKNVVADITFNINGCLIPLAATANEDAESDAADHIGDSTLSLVAPKAQELFPTVTLHSPATCVMCRFSADDLLANSRKEIGAPHGVTVYSVDGSVLLDDNSNSVEDVDDFLDTSSALNAFPHEEVAL